MVLRAGRDRAGAGTKRHSGFDSRGDTPQRALPARCVADHRGLCGLHLGIHVGWQWQVQSGQHRAATLSGANRPDDESVVLVFPTEARPAPQNKIAIDGLRPGDPFPHDDSHNLQLLRSLGGECVRTDEQGQFELQLPDAGQFFVLVVSKNAYRNPGQQFAQGEMNDIAQLGRYVQSATDLLGNSKYEWRQVAVRGDRRLEFAF